MSYIDQNLSSGETVRYRTRLHWIVMVVPIIVAGLAGLAGIGFLVASVSALREKSGNAGALVLAGVALVGAAAVIVAVASWKRSATEMAVTNKRVLVKVGLLSRRSTEIMLSKIESVIVEQGLWARMLGFGTILVRGVGGTPEPFPRIAHPLEFRRQVQEQIDRLPEGRAATPNL